MTYFVCLGHDVSMVETSINRLITTEEAADYLGVSKAFLEKDRWAGARIPFVKIDRAVRYRVEDINSCYRSSPSVMK